MADGASYEKGGANVKYSRSGGKDIYEITKGEKKISVNIVSTYDSRLVYGVGEIGYGNHSITIDMDGNSNHYKIYGCRSGDGGGWGLSKRSHEGITSDLREGNNNGAANLFEEYIITSDELTELVIKEREKNAAKNAAKEENREKIKDKKVNFDMSLMDFIKFNNKRP